MGGCGRWHAGGVCGRQRSWTRASCEASSFPPREATGGDFPLPVAGKRFSAKKPHFPWRETDLQKILPPSRRTKPFFGRFYRFPAAGNRFSENFSHFPPREGVFLRIYPISRRGKAFFGSFDRFPAAGRRLEDPVIGFAFHFGVSREQRSISCLRTTFLLQKHLAPIQGEHRIFWHFMHLCIANKHPERNENTRSDPAPGHEI